MLVISVGGSAINPGVVQNKFLEDLKKAILKHSKKEKIVICTGGGFIARDYIKALRLEKINENKQDLIGIDCTRLNARLVAFILKDCNQEIPKTVKEVKKLHRKHRIVVCGGLGPGKTSDGTTASIAKELGAKTLVNMTNVKGLFNKNPKVYKNAKFIPKISHKEFKVFVDKVHEKPGQHFVLDSYAAKICRGRNINVVILKGVKQLDNYLKGKKFVGTIVS